MQGVLVALRNLWMYIVMLLCLPPVQTQQSKTLIQASMAAKASTSTSKKMKRKEKTKKNTKPIEDDEESIDALPWNSSLPDDFDPFDTTSTTNNLHGGFISLEEINEVEYDLSVAPESKKRDRTVFEEASVRLAEEKAKRNKRKKEKKRKKKEIEKREREREAKVERILELKEKKGKKDKEQLQVLWQELLQETKGKDAKEKLQELLNEKKGAKVKKNNGETSDDSKSSAISSQEEIKISDEAVEDESQFYAWNDLRLHPLLMKAIETLGFKEPTPIQKACIPAAAHQGKDVIGAAETGSGKTLAFGLPILQRLLEEREKAAKSEGNTMKESDKESPLRALIITPTRELSIQVADHLKKVARFTSIGVVPIVGGMSSEKQERLLNSRPEIVVGTPGRLWELMSGGGNHLSELHSLSFFVLDEADRMVENGHFKELQSIIDLLPMSIGSVEAHQRSTQDCVTILNLQQKKRQTFVFSATIALSADFRKKLKRGSHDTKNSMKEGTISCLETLSGRAGMRADAAIIDLTNTSILANKLEESFVECREEDKDAYLYYLLSVHGQCRTIVFCTSISSLRHISSLLRILGINALTLNAQMQQRARIKAVDRFRENEHSVLVATDVAARGLDIPGVRTVIHYQLPHSAEVYVHRSGRTARASAEGCSIALISPNDKSKFASLCRSFSKDSYQRFPIDSLYMPEVMKRLSLARQIDKMTLKDSKENAKQSMVERTAESLGLILDDYDSEEERVNKHKQKKKAELHLMQLKQNLNLLLSRPLQPKTLSHRFLAGSGVSPLLQNQFEEIARPKEDKDSLVENKRRKLVVIGQDCTDPLEALRNAKKEGRVDVKEKVDNRRSMESLKRKRKQEKKLLRDKRRKQRKEMKKLEENREDNSEDISEDNCE